MVKRWSPYILAGLAFGVADWYMLEGLRLFSQSGAADNLAPPLQLLLLALLMGVNFGVWLLPLAWAARREARRSVSIRRAALAGLIVWCSAVFGYYLYYTVLLAFWGLPHMEHLLASNLSSPTYWQDWAPAFRRVILDQFLDWIGVAVVGGALGGSLVAFLYTRLQARKGMVASAARLVSAILIISLPFLAALFPHPAYACSCAPPGSPQETLDQAAAVFAGEVVRLKEPVPVGGIISSADPVRVTFAVGTVWKGPLQPELTVTTPLHDASCGYTFQIGKDYLVYAYEGETGLQTHLCTRNQLLPSAVEDLAVLGPGSAPPAPEAAPAPTLALLAVLSAVLLAGTLFHRRD